MRSRQVQTVSAVTRVAVVLVMAAQAVMGLRMASQAVWRDRAHGVADRLGGGVEDRMRRSLGDDSAIAKVLVASARPGEWALVRFDAASGFSGDGVARASRLTALRHASFPRPLLVAAGPNPIAVVESSPVGNGSALLLALDTDPEPALRDGWRNVAGGHGFSLWRYERR